MQGINRKISYQLRVSNQIKIKRYWWEIDKKHKHGDHN